MVLIWKLFGILLWLFKIRLVMIWLIFGVILNLILNLLLVIKILDFLGYVFNIGVWFLVWGWMFVYCLIILVLISIGNVWYVCCSMLFNWWFVVFGVLNLCLLVDFMVIVLLVCGMMCSVFVNSWGCEVVLNLRMVVCFFILFLMGLFNFCVSVCKFC